MEVSIYAMNKLIKKQNIFYFSVIIFIDCIFVSASFLLEQQRMIIWVLIVWSNLLFYTLLSFFERSALFAFLIAFFTFLVGRQTLERFQLHAVLLFFPEELNCFSEKLLLISLVSFGIGFIIYTRKPKKEVQQSTNWVKSIQYVSKLVFYFSILFLLISIADTAFYVLKNGYLSYYTSYSRRVPYLVSKIGDMSVVAFWIFMATLPKRTECRLAIALYLLQLAATLFTGQRYPFVSGLLVLFIYFNYRNTVCKIDEKKWVDSKILIGCIILSPVLIALLNTINQVRFGSLGQGIDNHFLSNFFYQQGVSINVIKRSIKFGEQLPDGKLFSLSNFFTALEGNLISRKLGMVSYSGNTVEHALYGNSLAHSLSYVVLGKEYLQGAGLGSSYIAEVYHDFGYIGVIIVNLFYGILFKSISLHKKGVWKVSINFVILGSLLLAPRGNADGFIGDLLDITTIFTYVMIYFFSKLFYKFYCIKTVSCFDY